METRDWKPRTFDGGVGGYSDLMSRPHRGASRLLDWEPEDNWGGLGALTPCVLVLILPFLGVIKYFRAHPVLKSNGTLWVESEESATHRQSLGRDGDSFLVHRRDRAGGRD